MRTKKLYTVSTFIFESLKEAEEKIEEWYKDQILKKDTKVFEISGIVYKPKLKLIKEKLE